jgi:hypothetical protein
MACYIISYDLRNDRDYESLYKAIKAYGIWARITESMWAVVTEESATQIRDYLLKHMDQDDRLFVVKSGIESAWTNVRCRNEWLRKHL